MGPYQEVHISKKAALVTISWLSATSGQRQQRLRHVLRTEALVNGLDVFRGEAPWRPNAEAKLRARAVRRNSKPTTGKRRAHVVEGPLQSESTERWRLSPRQTKLAGTLLSARLPRRAAP